VNYKTNVTHVVQFYGSAFATLGLGKNSLPVLFAFFLHAALKTS
jgi:hypothetical protein